jgi:hypothetical protein
VVQLKAVFPHGAGFVLAFEFMLSDLAEVVRHAQRPLAPAQVKSYLQMLLKGVAFCHANNIVHRVSSSMGRGGRDGTGLALALEEGMVGHLKRKVWSALGGQPANPSCLKVLWGDIGLMAPFVSPGPETCQPTYQCLRPAQDS